jgi:hypothetical protein
MIPTIDLNLFLFLFFDTDARNVAVCHESSLLITAH